MLSLPLLKKEIKSNYKLILIFFAILTLYSVSIVYLYDPSMTNAFEEITKVMPEIMKAFGMASSGNNLTEFIGNYLYGLIILMFPIICMMILGNKLIASYVDKGSMAYLIGTPNKRIKIAFTQAVFMWVTSAVLLIYATTIIIVLCKLLHPGALDVKGFIILNLVLYSLHLAVSGICFFASCISNDTKVYFTIAAGIPVYFYLIQALANMGGKLEKLKYFTLYSLFNPINIIRGENIVIPLIVLVLLAVVLYGAGMYIFSKRDLPL